MDAREAIQELEGMKDRFNQDLYGTEHEALDTAIEALEVMSGVMSGNAKELTKNAKDLISRQDVVRLLVEKYKFTTPEATEILNEIPSADTDLSHYSDKLWKSAFERGKNEVLAYMKGVDHE